MSEGPETIDQRFETPTADVDTVAIGERGLAGATRERGEPGRLHALTKNQHLGLAFLALTSADHHENMRIAGGDVPGRRVSR